MGDWPAASGARIESAGPLAPSSTGTLITSGGSANTKGNWTQLIASTSFASSEVMLVARFSGSAHLLDIGIGAAGSETIIVPDFHYSGLNAVAQVIKFPLAIPAGVRIAARSAAAGASATIAMSLYLLGEGFDRPSPNNNITAYGVNAVNSGAVAIDPGLTPHTKGSWAEITSGTSKAHSGLILCTTEDQNASLSSNGDWLFDLGIGASGSETVLLSNYEVRGTSSGILEPQWSAVLPASIPEATRLAVRAQCSITTTSRILHAAVYGVS